MKLARQLGLCSSLLLTYWNLGASEPGLENMYWRAASVDGEKLDLATEQIPHIAFHKEENRVAGFGGCNRFFATYQQQDATLRISVMGGGRAQCPELDNLESKFLGALQSTQQFSISNNTLLLMNGNDTLIEFVGVER
ncbi:MAG: META domain-containing protein [Gammaproteobacteria bacterium]